MGTETKRIIAPLRPAHATTSLPTLREYDPPSEMGPTNHTTNYVSLREPCRGVWGQLKNGRHDSLDTEVGVLIAITDHVPSLPKGGTFRHRSRVTRTHTITTHKASEIPHIYPMASDPIPDDTRRIGILDIRKNLLKFR
ncbi:hypothetical protein AVEN_136386-1 [Araneus ventricosus]|uniref:Uncharacterized protein n=1 Tax=Araneus ventricosus TaxID=182803 RepID=A0A4Y2U3D1_ARAVE|nr:hypothetical protein AVEN_136386-1 [Araneus ventricosus]